WRTLGWFVAGLTANAAYGLLELAVAETSGANLDRAVLSPIGAYQRGGINVFGLVGDAEVYRTNALTLDPNHLAVMLVVPLLVLFPLYLRLDRDHRWRLPLAGVLGFLLIAELATLSRSGALGLAVGLLVLALPYGRRLVSPRVLVPLGAVAGVVALFVAQRAGFFETVLRARTSLEGGGGRAHLELYELLPPVLEGNPLFGRGLNTFSTYFEFVTGRTNWGPHSYYVAVISESGLIGLALFVAYLAYLLRRLKVLHRLGARLALVRPLAWGLTAALAGTLAANAFYLTMQMYYFFVFAMLAFAAPVVFGRGLDSSLAAPVDGGAEQRPRRKDDR
ncbi:MAG: O-antigen ligase family protein, partial [Gaiellales bacterium]